jgi:hypothetical protein
MYQIIDGLLKKDVKPYNIMYFSFDEMRYDLEEISMLVLRLAVLPRCFSKPRPSPILKKERLRNITFFP